MYLDKFGRSWEGPFPFTLQEVNSAAKAAKSAKTKSGLYQILYMRQPVYIGMSSVSVFGRLRSHVKGTGNQLAGKRADADFYAFVYWFCDGRTASEIESHTTIEHKPGFNQKIEYINYIANITVH
jgi:hypothetical protein